MGIFVRADQMRKIMSCSWLRGLGFNGRIRSYWAQCPERLLSSEVSCYYRSCSGLPQSAVLPTVGSEV